MVLMIPLGHQANAFYTSSSSPYHHLFRQQTVPKVYTIRSFHDWNTPCAHARLPSMIMQ